MSENWYIPYEADIGAGDTDLSWQLVYWSRLSLRLL